MALHQDNGGFRRKGCFNNSGLRVVARGNKRASRKVLQTASQFRNLSPTNGVDPTFGLNLKQRAAKRPETMSGFGFHVYSAIL